MDPTIQEPIGYLAAAEFHKVFATEHWTVQREAHGERAREDLILTNRFGHTYHAVLKASAEGRPDRLIALFSQALLEARVYATRNQGHPAVLLWVKSGSNSLVKRLEAFRDEFAPDTAFALISGDGLRHIRFPGLERNSTATYRVAYKHTSHVVAPPRLTFSDRTQWMLKLLLAPDVPESMLSAPRARYHSAAELARAAGVSSMTASRLVNALVEEGFLDTADSLQLVRRSKLAERWKASYQKPAAAVPMKFLVPGTASKQMEKLLAHQPGVLGSFAAADALGVGHVRGVPPYVYVERLEQAASWKALKAAREGETPDLFLVQVIFPTSVGKGAVERDGTRVTDILQTWLDVSSNPARGAEQAALLEKGVLANVIGAGA